jgi:hypothetical protein
MAKRGHGPIPRSPNHFLKWTFLEATNVIATHQKQWAQRQVVRLYQRLRAAKCHGEAGTAVARHLAESSWWILTKKNPIVSRTGPRCLRRQERVSAAAILAS